MNDFMLLFLLGVLVYTQYNLWIVKKQLELLQKTLDELRSNK